METRNIGSFDVATTLIESALHIPGGHEIVGAEWNFAARTIRLFVEGPCMPIVDRGEQVPSISPSVSVCQNEAGERTHVWSFGTIL